MPTPALDPTILTLGQTVVEVLGTIAFAVSGVIGAARRRLDAVGVCAVAALAAFGGGTVRDIILDRRPLFWVEFEWMLWLVVGVAIFSMTLLKARHLDRAEKLLLLPDALGLGLFAAGGTAIALQADVAPFIAMLMGVITAVTGGILRDVVCNDIPAVFHDHRPYAFFALIGAAVMVVLTRLDLPPDLCLIASAATGTVLRVFAVWRDWRLPAWRLDD